MFAGRIRRKLLACRKEGRAAALVGFAAALTALMLLVAPAAAQTLPQATSTASSSEEVTTTDLDTLIKVLEDDTSRAALLERLKSAASAEPVATPVAEPDLSLARQFAEYTRYLAEGISAMVTAIPTLVTDLPRTLASEEFAAFRTMAVGVSLTALALFATFFVLRLATVPLQARIAERVEGRKWPARLAGALGATALHAAAAIAAWAIGYALALNFFGTSAGRIGINQSLLLNAFVIVEAVNLVILAVMMPRFAALRLLPANDTNAAYWWFWLTRIASLLGYGFLFVAPVVTATLSFGAGDGIRFLTICMAAIIGVLLILQNREAVRARLSARFEAGDHGSFARIMQVIGQYWHIVAVAYLVSLVVVYVTNPVHALPFMLAATSQSIIIIAVAMLISTLIGRTVDAGIALPEDLREKLPLLQGRLRAFVPRVMNVVRLLIAIAAVLAVAQVWAVFDVLAWLNTSLGQQVIGSVLSAGTIIAAGIVAYIAMSSWVEYRLNPNFGTVPTAREKTLLSLLRNAFVVALVILVGMLALAQIGINIAPLLAGAGVIGLAIGFGAQKLVQDIITGAFIQFENVMNEGDVVEAGGKSGVVERLTIRSVSIRDLEGTLHLIPFSSVDQVSNRVRGFAYHVAEIGVAYDSDIETVKAAMFEAFEQLKQTEHGDAIVGDLDMHGITAFGDSAITVRARIMTLPGKQWGVGRAYNEYIKTVFAARGVEIPYPHVTLQMSGDGVLPLPKP